MSSGKKFQFKNNIPIISITCYGRSGSVLLHSLLDNHPQLISVPAHCLVVPAAKANLYDYMAEVLPRSSLQKVVEDTVFMFPYLFKETDQTPVLFSAAKLSEIGVPREQFAQVLFQLLSKSRSGHSDPGFYFRALHYAYNICLGRDVSDIQAVIWQPHSPFQDEAEKGWLINNLRNVRFLVPVRRPEVTISSHFHAKNFDEGGPATLNDITHVLLSAFFGCRIHHDLNDFAVAVRFEDMHGRTERVTRALAKWIGITWHRNMLEPTVDGQEMLFPKGGSVVRGLNPNIESKQSAKHFNFVDKVVFSAFNLVAYRQWGYDLNEFPLSINKLIRSLAVVIPLKMEFILFMISLRSGEGILGACKKALDRRKQTHEILKAFWFVNTSVGDCKLIKPLNI